MNEYFPAMDWPGGRRSDAACEQRTLRMSQQIKCPRCGCRHSADLLGGACPDCLVRITLQRGSAKSGAKPGPSKAAPQFPPKLRLPNGSADAR